MSFLKAEWRKLIMANYEVDPAILEPYVPFGTELDFYDDKCYVSLVGFMFMNTKLLGVKIPFHINFEEVNLRFYVKKEEKRGVVFIKEIVPKPALSFVANTVYKENYVTRSMSHKWIKHEDDLDVEYSWGKENLISVKAQLKPIEINENSLTEFIAEHYWGYSKVNDKQTTEYEVKHPRWKSYPVKEYKISVDFRDNYGTSFNFLNHKKPSSVFLLEGSEVSVENKKIIK
ncbi:DUF2071 domain-containing protein [Pseudotenacibaculum sp. MALMAid0570]|uniref:YqjF family protein n=1 Tax=Pseudotenacibaculum sp. MALMAid0570 TaxID=3143938 RepID=UPI0032DF3261